MTTLPVPKLDFASMATLEPSSDPPPDLSHDPSLETPLVTPRTRDEMKKGTAHLTARLTQLRKLVTRCTPRLSTPESEPEPTPPPYDFRIPGIITRGYLNREEMQDAMLLGQLCHKNIKLKASPRDDPDLFTLTLEDLEGHFLCLDVVNPSNGRVIRGEVPADKRTKYLGNYVWMVTLESIKRFFTPSKDFCHYYDPRSFNQGMPLLAKEKEWYERLGKYVPTTRAWSFAGKTCPFGVFQPVMYNGSQFHYLDEINELFRSSINIMIPLVILDDEGYPLTSPEIPNFG